MEWIEVDPLPAVCRQCHEEECYNCDFAGMRWHLSKKDALLLKRKSLAKAIERMQRQIDEIDQMLGKF